MFKFNCSLGNRYFWRCVKFINESFYNMRCLVMFITAICLIFLKESWPRGTWKLAVVEKLISNTDGGNQRSYSPSSFRKVSKPYAQLLVPPGMCWKRLKLQTSPAEVRMTSMMQATRELDGTELNTERSIRKAAIKARLALNKLLNI